MRRNILNTLIIAITLWMAHCANEGEGQRQVVNAKRLALRLADGRPLSLPNYEERSPQMVQHPSGYLSLLFVSDRPCNNNLNPGCIGDFYNVFVARSLAPYHGGALPPFSEPLTVRAIGGSPGAQYSSLQLIAAHAEGENVVFYQKAGSQGAIFRRVLDPVTGQLTEYPTYSQPGPYDLLGIHEYDGNKLYLRYQNSIYYTPFSASLGDSFGNRLVYSQNRAEDIVNIAGLPLELEGGIPFFHSSDGGLVLGVNSAYSGFGHLSFMMAVLRELMLMHEIDVVKTNNPGQELLIFSGASLRQGDTSMDLYVVSSHTARELWYIGRREHYGIPFSDLPPIIVLRAFITDQSFNGTFAGASGADTHCNSDSARPAWGSFKAFLFGTGGSDTFGRPATLYNTLLQPNTLYFKADGVTPFFRTNAESKIVEIYEPDNRQVWTGLDANYNSGNRCADAYGVSWSNSYASGAYGKLQEGHFPFSANTSCNMNNRLLCVEVP
ncbi:MAG: DUF1554 domain-containing protein [Leptospiraceae bacterium]|nr:DUF1554 domain-containing protein [Leptospiraceae bacterium]